jgi:DNA-binding SARP family transcriptional activator
MIFGSDAVKYCVQTFGDFRIVSGDQVIDILCNSQKACELFALMLSSFPSKLPDDEIFRILWPGMNYHKAGQNLNSTIYLLRKGLKDTLCEEALSIVHHARSMSWLELTDDFSIDFVELERIFGEVDSTVEMEAKIFKLEKTVELYKGVFMNEFSSSSWVRPFQRYYMGLINHSLIELTRLNYLSGKFSESIRYTLKALKQDPLNQSARRWKTLLVEQQRLQSDHSSRSHELDEQIRLHEETADRTNRPAIPKTLRAIDSNGFLQEIDKLVVDEDGSNMLLSIQMIGDEDTVKNDSEEFCKILGSLLRNGDFISWKNEKALLILLNVEPSSIRAVINRLLKGGPVVNYLSSRNIRISYEMQQIDSSLDRDKLRKLLS